MSESWVLFPSLVGDPHCLQYCANKISPSSIVLRNENRGITGCLNGTGQHQWLHCQQCGGYFCSCPALLPLTQGQYLWLVLSSPLLHYTPEWEHLVGAGNLSATMQEVHKVKNTAYLIRWCCPSPPLPLPQRKSRDAYIGLRNESF